MKRTLVEVYALAVCFVTLVCFVVALGIGIYDIIQIVNPEFTMASYTYERHQSNDGFLRDWPKDKAPPATQEVTSLRQASYQAALRSEKRDAFQSLTRVLIIVLIDTIVFAVHWSMGKQARSMTAAS